jgi:putative regulator of septum formation
MSTNLEVGDCLYVRAVADQSSDRPIGEPHDVAGALLAGEAERAACDASHGHEVSAVVVPALETLAPGATPTLLDHAQMQALTGPLCDAAFAAYVGHALSGSRYITFPVVPDTDAAAGWAAGGRRTVCLVARADGQWMDHPARGSGE